MNKKDMLVQIISENSDRYGNLLVDFMEEYNLVGLRQATREQLEEYIERNMNNGCSKIYKGKRKNVQK